jgi:hypothetical protein
MSPPTGLFLLSNLPGQYTDVDIQIPWCHTTYRHVWPVQGGGSCHGDVDERAASTEHI